MRNQGKSALLMAGLAIAAVVTASPADARPFCDQAGSTTTCRTNGSVSIKAEPGQVMAPAGTRGLIPWQAGGRRAYGGRR
ncbi:MAG: hypothetical protein K0U76_10110 [Actinomycetia bacterium]|nr:hypothetical protein [Actinomycetes bacterium]MCH9701733.1 hypothetical protein [Actinomycetes bacterium]MCH9760440.1 hypothetical protein [Actinomycetes bacterium]